jgi:PTH1 family peptidyl-tRNA hydrolase
MDNPPENSPSLQLPSAPYIIAGLGNPGREYAKTRHNVGFMLMDRLANRVSTTFSRVESKALVAKGEFAGKRLILVKPQTFMNLSGQAVGALVRYYKVPINQIMVAYDDVDLPLGLLRIRPGGGSAGQKGMVSIIERLNTQDFPRLRIGIDRPPGRMEATAYVLEPFDKVQAVLLAEILDRAVQAVLTFVESGLETAMNRYNGGLER